MKGKLRAALDTARHAATGPIYDARLNGQPFELSMQRPHHRILRGDFEPWTQQALIDHTSGDQTFWEVGARWGVLSLWLLAAGRISHASLFEADPDRVAHCARSICHNDLADRAHLHQARLGPELTLDEFGPAPDLLTVDLEGAEADLIPASHDTLAGMPTWIVEQHEHEGGLRDTFEAFGYDVTQLHADAEREWLLAEGNE